MTRALLQQALDALEHHQELTRPINKTLFTIDALRTALASPDQPDDEGCWKCGEDGGTSCGDPQCGLLTAEQPVPDGYVRVPIEPTEGILRAMAESRASDDEGVFDPLLDLIGFSGDNKTCTVLREAYRKAIAAAPSPEGEKP